MFNSSDDGGSITLRLPENSSREVFSSSTGSTSVPSSISYYFIRVRKSGEVVQEAKASPGSSVTIGDLYPGEYTVAVFGVDSSGIVNFYGRSPDVQVIAGQTSQAAVKLVDVVDIEVTIDVHFVDSVATAATSFSITANGGGTSHSYTVADNVIDNNAILHIIGSSAVLPTSVSNFLEPLIPYKLSVKATSSDWTRSYSGSATIILGEGTYPTVYLK